MALVLVTLNDLEDHSQVADLLKCNPSNICAAFYQISTDIVLARSLSDSWDSCYYLFIQDYLAPPRVKYSILLATPTYLR